MEKYRPSNGTEGEAFHSKWCANCIHDQYTDDNLDGGCQLIASAMIFDIDDEGFPKQWRVINGEPTCTAFSQDKEACQRCDKTHDMFGGDKS